MLSRDNDEILIKSKNGGDKTIQSAANIVFDAIFSLSSSSC
jgi:hypothetical protein